MAGDTRDRIIEAAFRMLSSQGYEATSVKDIATEAGVAPGLVHYYFETKEDLVLAALVYACKQIEQPTGDPTEFALNAFESAKSDLDAHRDFQRLMFEMVALALHNPRVAEKVLEFVRFDRGHVERIASQVLAQREDPRPERAAAVAAAVWGAFWGIALQNLVDPEFDSPAAIDALAEMAISNTMAPPAVERAKWSGPDHQEDDDV